MSDAETRARERALSAVGATDSLAALAARLRAGLPEADQRVAEACAAGQYARLAAFAALAGRWQLARDAAGLACKNAVAEEIAREKARASSPARNRSGAPRSVHKLARRATGMERVRWDALDDAIARAWRGELRLLEQRGLAGLLAELRAGWGARWALLAELDADDGVLVTTSELGDRGLLRREVPMSMIRRLAATATAEARARGRPHVETGEHGRGAAVAALAIPVVDRPAADGRLVTARAWITAVAYPQRPLPAEDGAEWDDAHGLWDLDHEEIMQRLGLAWGHRALTADELASCWTLA